MPTVVKNMKILAQFVGLAFNVATWAAVKVWCIFLGSGLLLTFSGYLIKS